MTFERFASQLGKTLDLETSGAKQFLVPSLAYSQTHYGGLGLLRNGIGEDFCFALGYVERKTAPNAVCGKAGNVHCCAVYHRTSLQLLELFCTLLASPNTLGFVGRPSAETGSWLEENGPPPGFGVATGRARIRSVYDIVEQYGPEDPERRRVAIEMYHAAMRFVWHHEMAHALGGHVSFLSSELGLQSIHEISEEDPTSSRADDGTRAVLETRADAGALFTSLLMPKMKGVPQQLQTAITGTQLVDDALVILSIALLGWLWCASTYIASGGSNAALYHWDSHPSSLARVINLVLRPIALADRFPGALRDAMIESVALASTELLRLADAAQMFAPFRWLVEPEMYSRLSAERLPAGYEETEKRVAFALGFYQFRPASESRAW